MNFNKFTIKAQQAMQSASEIAASYSNQQIEPEHLFAALIQNNESIAVLLMNKIGINIDFIKVKITGFIEKLPKISSATSSNQYMSGNMQKVLDDAIKIAGEMRDE